MSILLSLMKFLYTSIDSHLHSSIVDCLLKIFRFPSEGSLCLYHVKMHWVGDNQDIYVLWCWTYSEMFRFFTEFNTLCYFKGLHADCFCHFTTLVNKHFYLEIRCIEKKRDKEALNKATRMLFYENANQWRMMMYRN